MARVVILGTAAAVTDAQHDHTHFVLIGERTGAILVDAGSNPFHKLQAMGLGVDDVSDVILSHFHTDHIGGIPNYILHLWQLGRTASLRFHGLHHCLDRLRLMMDAFSWKSWPDLYPVEYNSLPEEPASPLLENEEFRITAWPVDHFVPTIGIRIENLLTGNILAYTCDTEPTPTLADLCRDADILIHEAAGPPPGHSTALMAGQHAQQARAKSLYLIHYQVWNTDPEPLVAEAQAAYDGPVALCRQYDTLEF